MKGIPQGTQILAHGRRILAASSVVAAILTGTAATASGQITFAGFVTYSFDAQSFGATRTLGGFSATQDGFSVTTNASGYAGIGGSGNSLARLSLAAIDFDFTGHIFQMQVAFTSPTSGNQTFFANVMGSISNHNGGVHLSFSPGIIKDIAFTNGPGSGLFDFSVNDVTVGAGQTDVRLTGDIFVHAGSNEQPGSGDPTTTPEPTSMALLATGLVGIIGVARRVKVTA